MSQVATAPRRRMHRLKPGTVLNLVVFLAVAIGLLIYYRPPRPIVPSIDTTSGFINEPVPVPTVLESRAPQMTRVTFHRGDEAFTLEHDGDRWNVTSPFTDRADDRLTTQLVESLAGIAFDEEIAEPEPDSAYGFDDPLIRAEFVLHSGSVESLIIGQPEGSIEYFVKTSASDSVYLVRNLPERLFSVIAGELIHGQLLDFNPADARKVSAITSTGESKVIERQGNAWFSDTEYGRALVFDVDVFLRDLNGITGSSIAATQEADQWEQLGLEPNPQTMYIEVELEDGSIHTLAVGGTTADGRRYFVRSSDRPHAYVVVEFSAANLERKLAAATTDILRVNTARITKVEVTTLGTGTEVVRTFSRHDDNHKQWNTEQRVAFYVPFLLESINGVTTFQRAPEGSDASYGFTGPDALNVKVTMENNATYTLEIGSVTNDGKHVFVRSSTRDGVYLAAFGDVADIRDNLDMIRTDLLPFQTELLEAIDITTVAANGTETVTTFVRSGDTWTRNGSDADVTKVQNMVTQLRGLRAEKLPMAVSEDAYKFYPAPNSLRAAIRTTDGNELVLYLGGSVVEGTGWFTTTSHFASVSNLDEVVFIADRINRDLRNAINGAIQ